MLAAFTKSSIIDVGLGCGYASAETNIWNTKHGINWDSKNMNSKFTPSHIWKLSNYYQTIT